MTITLQGAHGKPVEVGLRKIGGPRHDTVEFRGVGQPAPVVRARDRLEHGHDVLPVPRTDQLVRQVRSDRGQPAPEFAFVLPRVPSRLDLATNAILSLRLSEPAAL